MLLIPADTAVLKGAEELLKEYLHQFSPGVHVYRYLFSSQGQKKKAKNQLEEVVKEIRGHSLQQALFREANLFIILNFPTYAGDTASQLADLAGDTNAVLLGVENPRKTEDLIEAVGKKGIVVSIRNLKKFQVRQAVMSAARVYGVQLTSSAVDAIMELVGTDRGYIESAVKALAESFGHERPITAQECRKVITKKTKVMPWDLTDAIGVRDLPRAVKTLRLMLDEGSDGLRILMMIQKHIQQLLVAQGVFKEKNPKDALHNLLGVPPFVAEKLLAQSRNFTLGELASFIKRLPQFEVQVKSHMSDPWAVLVNVVSSIVVKRQ